MSTLIYSPEIRVHIAADGTSLGDYKGKTYDISDDLVQGSLIIRTNGVHTFNFQLQNAQRKYDGVLTPMDRITVEMKRITWVRVFSGYLNNGPVFSAWPRVLSMSASCTLKRLQFWYWDPAAPASSNMLKLAFSADGQNAPGAAATNQTSPVNASTDAGGAGVKVQGALNPRDARRARRGLVVGDNPVTPGLTPAQTQQAAQAPPAPPPATAPPGGAPQDPAQGAPGGQGGTGEAGQQKFDDGIKGAVMKLLNQVVGWPQEKIHIGEIPPAWIKLASDVGNAILKDAAVDKALIGDLSKGDPAVTGSATAGGFAMGATSADQQGIVKIIADVARGRFGGQARQAAIIGVATGIVESGLRNLAGGDRDSVGVFQQRPSQGWGTVEQCMNVTYAAGAFFARFPGNWASQDPGAVAQSVQRSAFPGKYDGAIPDATALVNQFGGM